MNIPRYKYLQQLIVITGNWIVLTNHRPAKINGGLAPHQITSPAHFPNSIQLQSQWGSSYFWSGSSSSTNNKIVSVLPRRFYLAIKPIPTLTSHSFSHSRPSTKDHLEKCWEKVIHRVSQICRPQTSWVTSVLTTSWTEQERLLQKQDHFILLPDSVTFQRTSSATVQHRLR